MFKKKKKLFQNNSSFPINKKLFSAVASFCSTIFRTKMLNIDATRGPLFITWLCTYKCNANCKFCSTHELHKQYPDNLSWQRAKEIAHEIGRAKTRVVGFTGGEVLLWPYLFDVINILKQYVDIYMPDFDIYSNKEIRKNAIKWVETGKKIFIPPKDIKGKDINDLVQHHGYKFKDIMSLIKNNIYNGVMANVKIQSIGSV